MAADGHFESVDAAADGPIYASLGDGKYSVRMHRCKHCMPIIGR